MAPPILAALRDLPRPADTGQVRVARERLANTILAPLLDEPAAAPLIDTLAGNSPFLTECLLAEPGAFMALLDEGPDTRMAALLAEAAQPGDDLARRLRRIRRAVALTVAVADIGGDCAYAAKGAALPVLSGRGVSNSGRGMVDISCDAPFMIVQG